MSRMDSFAHRDPFPAWFANSVQDRLAALSNFRLRRVASSSVMIEVPAAADDGRVALNIDGLWRWITATLQVAHPGGLAGQYAVFATCKSNDIVSSPDPFTDDTDYSFGLAIRKDDGTTPPIVPGVVDHFRRVGRLQWSGTAITSVVPEVGAASGVEVAPDDFYALNGVQLREDATARIYAQAASDVRTNAAFGAARNLVAAQGDASQVTVGAYPGGSAGVRFGLALDANFYRVAAGVVKTDGESRAGGQLRAKDAASSQVRIGDRGPGGEAGISFGPADDASLYRWGSNSIKTPGMLRAGGNLLAQDGAAGQVTVGDIGFGTPGVVLGLANDITLWRPAAGVATVGSGALAQAIGLSANFPAGATDGQKWIFKVDADVVWEFRYSQISGKWHFTGGPPLRVDAASVYTLAAVGFTNGGPNVVVPLSAYYLVRWGAQTWYSDPGRFQTYYGIDLVNNGDALGVIAYQATDFDEWENPTQSVRHNLNAGSTVYSNYAGTSTQNRWQSRWLEILPIRSQ